MPFACGLGCADSSEFTLVQRHFQFFAHFPLHARLLSVFRAGVNANHGFGRVDVFHSQHGGSLNNCRDVVFHFAARLFQVCDHFLHIDVRWQGEIDGGLHHATGVVGERFDVAVEQEMKVTVG